MERRIRFFLAVTLACGVLTAATAAHSQYRDEVSLDGTWTFTPTVAWDAPSAPRNPATVPAGTITVPSAWSDLNPDCDDEWDPGSSWNKYIDEAVYSRTFDVPASFAG